MQHRTGRDGNREQSYDQHSRHSRQQGRKPQYGGNPRSYNKRHQYGGQPQSNGYAASRYSQPKRRSVAEEIFNPTEVPWKSSDFYAAHPSPYKKNGRRQQGFQERNQNRYQTEPNGNQRWQPRRKRRKGWNEQYNGSYSGR